MTIRHVREVTSGWAVVSDVSMVPWRARLDCVKQSVLERIHNPANRECGCDPDCWCRRTTLGRAVKWWLPARLIGLHHKNDAVADWKRSHDQD